MAQPTQYLDEYTKFVDSYKYGEVSAEEIGLMIARFANFFAMYNLELTMAEFERAKIAASIESKVDDNGKQISSTKAQVLTDATPESAEYRKRRAHVVNLEQIINGLKSLQRGALQEYTHLGNT